MASPTVPYQTYRITNVPLTLQNSQLLAFVKHHVQHEIAGLSLALTNDKKSKCATVTLPANPLDTRLLDAQENNFRHLPWEIILPDLSQSRPRIDRHFFGLTPLTDVVPGDEDAVE